MIIQTVPYAAEIFAPKTALEIYLAYLRMPNGQGLVIGIEPIGHQPRTELGELPYLPVKTRGIPAPFYVKVSRSLGLAAQAGTDQLVYPGVFAFVAEHFPVMLADGFVHAHVETAEVSVDGFYTK